MEIMVPVIPQKKLERFERYRDGLLIAVENQFENQKNPYYPPTQQQLKGLIPAIRKCLRNPDNRKEVVRLLLGRDSLSSMNNLWRAEISAMIDNMVDTDKDWQIYYEALDAIQIAEEIVDIAAGVADRIEETLNDT